MQEADGGTAYPIPSAQLERPRGVASAHCPGRHRASSQGTLVGPVRSSTRSSLGPMYVCTYSGPEPEPGPRGRARRFQTELCPSVLSHSWGNPFDGQMRECGLLRPNATETGPLLVHHLYLPLGLFRGKEVPRCAQSRFAGQLWPGTAEVGLPVPKLPT